MEQRFLSPNILAGISGLDLVAKTAVDGFAEYRAYGPGEWWLRRKWGIV
jgi:hypothetical protein